MQRQGVLTTFAIPVNMPNKKVESPKWYLLYTNPRAEKKVNEELKKRGFETFLPLHKTLKQWSDRKKWVEEPMFKGYLFLYTELERNYFEIVHTPGVVMFVNFEKRPAVVDIREIELVKLVLGEFSDIEALQSSELELIEGDEVEIVAGVLIGITGKLIQYKGKSKVMLACKSFDQSLILELPLTHIKKQKAVLV